MCMLLILKNVIILAVLHVLIFALIKKTLYNEKDNPHSTFVVIYLIKKMLEKMQFFTKDCIK